MYNKIEAVLLYNHQTSPFIAIVCVVGEFLVLRKICKMK